jgi:hypothetical protein
VYDETGPRQGFKKSARNVDCDTEGSTQAKNLVRLEFMRDGEDSLLTSNTLVSRVCNVDDTHMHTHPKQITTPILGLAPDGKIRTFAECMEISYDCCCKISRR